MQEGATVSLRTMADSYFPSSHWFMVRLWSNKAIPLDISIGLFLLLSVILKRFLLVAVMDEFSDALAEEEVK